MQVVIILITTLFFCPLAGYGFAKFEFRGKRFLFGLMMLTLFFVPITQYIPLLIELNNFGWIDTYQGLVLPLVISSFGIFWMNGVIAAVPNELLHAARVDGCGSFSTWWRIVLPVIRPALVSLAMVTFLTAYNDYFWPLLIVPGLQTSQVILGGLQTALLTNSVTATSNWGALLAGSTVVFAHRRRFPGDAALLPAWGAAGQHQRIGPLHSPGGTPWGKAIAEHLRIV